MSTAGEVSHPDTTTSIEPPIEAQQPCNEPKETAPKETQYGWRFWLVFPSLCIVAFMASLEATILTTALPTINRSLNTGENYIWVINIFFLTSAAFQPLYGQCANALGRRLVMVVAISIFLIGSAVGGSAYSTGQLIAARAIQGIGSGGMVMMLELIVSDLVPVRERAAFMAVIFAAVNAGTALGPFIGGEIVETTSWRWVFYINLPIGGLALIIVLLCLNVSYRRELVGERIRRIDYFGNIILIASTVSTLFALTYGNVRYPWGDWHTLVPLILGLFGYMLFATYEASPFPREPVAPLRLFSNRTSAAVYLVAFLWNILTLWRIYFLSIYFQAVKGSSPIHAGVQLLPSVLMLFPAVAIGGVIVKKTGRYRNIHFVGLGLLTVGQGLYSLLGPSSPASEWIIFQIVTGFFGNLLLPVMLPAIQAGLPESDAAASVAFWGFLRTLAITWGVSIPAAIFNSRFDSLAYRITDPTVRSQFSHGQAYEKASKYIISDLQGLTRVQVIAVYAAALKRTWEVSIAFAGLAFLVVFFEREIPMRTTVESEYGLKEKEKDREEGNPKGKEQNQKQAQELSVDGHGGTDVVKSD